jgi:branched-chain amino acid transport system permease protein
MNFMKINNKYLFLIIIFAVLFLLFLPFVTPYKALASQMLVFAIFAIGYDIAFGYTGLLSFGHAAFFGLGAYGTGLSLIHLSIPAPLAILIGVVIGLLIAFPIGYLSIRRRGIYFAMVTLAFAQMVYFIAFKWRSLTGGDDGLHGVPRPPLGPIDLSSELVLYYFILFFFIFSVILGIRIINSPFGKTLECVRENVDRARSIGYNPTRFKLISFVISAFFAGLAGGLYTLLQNFVPLFTLGLDTSGDIVLMTLIGGMGTLYGPIMGAMALIFLKDLLSTYTNIWPLFLGLLFVVSVMTFRKGVFKELKEKLLKF